MGQVSLKQKIDLYARSLADALVQESNNTLSLEIAEAIARQYASHLDFNDPLVMHVGVTSIASNLIKKVKPEYLTDIA
ncbi:TPA: hypothetical protein ACT2FU_001237 [Streptococcus suis]